MLAVINGDYDLKTVGVNGVIETYESQKLITNEILYLL